MKKQIAVFGLGHFGGHLVNEFNSMGVDVLAIDKSQDRVDDFASIVTHAVACDATIESNLISLGVKNFDFAIVSFGEKMEASVLTCLMLKELGIPKVWAKAQDKYHQKVLESVGVDHVILPERDMAKRIAHLMMSEKMTDYIELTDEFSIVEIKATKKIHQKTLGDIDVKGKYGCNIVAIKRGKNIDVSPQGYTEILNNDILFVIGHKYDIERFEAKEV